LEGLRHGTDRLHSRRTVPGRRARVSAGGVCPNWGCDTSNGDAPVIVDLEGISHRPLAIPFRQPAVGKPRFFIRAHGEWTRRSGNSQRGLAAAGPCSPRQPWSSRATSRELSEDVCHIPGCGWLPEESFIRLTVKKKWAGVPFPGRTGSRPATTTVVTPLRGRNLVQLAMVGGA